MSSLLASAIPQMSDSLLRVCLNVSQSFRGPFHFWLEWLVCIFFPHFFPWAVSLLFLVWQELFGRYWNQLFSVMEVATIFSHCDFVPAWSGFKVVYLCLVTFPHLSPTAWRLEWLRTPRGLTGACSPQVYFSCPFPNTTACSCAPQEHCRPA